MSTDDIRGQAFPDEMNNYDDPLNTDLADLDPSDRDLAAVTDATGAGDPDLGEPDDLGDLDDLDEDLDRRSDDYAGVADPEQTRFVPDEAARRGQSADEAGGSVAAALREEDPSPAEASRPDGL